MSSGIRDKNKLYCVRGHARTPENLRPHGNTRQCRLCHNYKEKHRYHSDPSYKRRTIARATLRNKHPKQKRIKQAWQARKKLKRFGLTQDQLDAMRAVQENLCFLCGKSKTLCIDHEHMTGRIRKLLCHNCNLGIGNFYDNPTVLRKAAEYLETF